MNIDISFRTNEGRFNYRVGGIIINNNKLLIMKDEQSQYYYIPGGRVLMNELSEAAIVREMREELNIEVKVNRLLWVNENLFREEHLDEVFHEICFYYLLDFNENELVNRGDEFIFNENGEQNHTFYWKELNEIKDFNLYPQFIKKSISQLPKLIEHVIETKL
jgi:ADP-ribose pyrophosphatase YjhB (NUDIX family)